MYLSEDHKHLFHDLLFFENTSVFTSSAEKGIASLKKLQDQIKIFPNPSGNEIIVNNESPMHISSLRVYGPDGKLVKEIRGQSIHRAFLGSGRRFLYIATSSRSKSI